MTDSNNGCKLLQFISEVSFVINEVTLFLDTHPTDRRALEYYESFRNARQQAIQDYTIQFGPITADFVDVNHSWSWVEGPWPWEVEG